MGNGTKKAISPRLKKAYKKAYGWIWDCLFKMISPQVADGKSLVQSIRGGSAEPEDHPVSIRSSDLQAFVLLCVNWCLRLVIYYSGPSRSPCTTVWDCQNTGGD